MAKECPDLTALSDQEIQEFWSGNTPQNLKLVGDRLMAESLPERPLRESVQFSGQQLAELREQLSLSLEEVAETLGVTVEILKAWESESLRPPESLGLIYRNWLEA